MGISISEEEIEDGFGEEADEDDFYDAPTKSTSVEDLEHLMQNAIENEEYEIAAQLRDRIQKLKGE